MDNPAYSLRLIKTAPAVMRHPRPFIHRPRPHWIVETVCRGYYEIRATGSDWIRLGEGEGVLYRPGVEFEERIPTGLCRSVFAIFEFDDSVLSEPLAMGQQVTRLLDPFVLARPTLEGLQHFADTPEGQIAKHGLLCRLVNLLAVARFEADSLVICEKDAQGSRFSDRVDGYMRKNLHQSLRIADIAAHMNMTASGVQHAYRRETGTSLMHSLRKMRIERVKAMLMKDGMGLDAIAGETGFCDAFHLSRCFKAQEGIPPKAFRRTHREVR